MFEEDVAAGQGRTLVHFSAQLESCLTQENTFHILNTRFTRATQPLHATPIPTNALKLSWKVDECKTLPPGLMLTRLGLPPSPGCSGAR